MNTKPPAVIIGPPRLGTPQWSERNGTDSAALASPNGTDQRICPFARSTATSELHGGGLQGRPQGDRMKTRLIAYGVPACGAISKRQAEGFVGAEALRDERRRQRRKRLRRRSPFARDVALRDGPLDDAKDGLAIFPVEDEEAAALGGRSLSMTMRQSVSEFTV